MTEPDLFGGTLRPQPTPERRTRPAKPTTPGRSDTTPAGGSPREALAALADVHDGRLGVLDNTGRIVQFTDHDQIRQAHNDHVITALTCSGYITENDKDRVSCRHGAIRRPVVPLKLTRAGRELLERWSALHGT